MAARKRPPRVRFIASVSCALLLVAAAWLPLGAQDVNIPHRIADVEERLWHGSLELLFREQARPQIDGDRSLRVLLGGQDMSVLAKWKPVGRGATGFNDEPRYELAAYRFQQLFLDEDEYVVPPVALRAMDLDDHRLLFPNSQPTLARTRSVLFLLALWIEEVTNDRPWNPPLFEVDTVYARHWANANILTHLIDHKDSNVGNLLISTVATNPRVFAVDNDVAFRSRSSNVGTEWRRLHVRRLPHRTVERLRALTPDALREALGVVAEFAIVDGRLESAPRGPNLDPRRGVRTTADRVQFGLTAQEIDDVAGRIRALLQQVDRGRLTVF
jgi:hypothetical protein